MKKLILLFVLISPLGVGGVFAQSTDISPNFVQFPRLSAAPACTNTDKGKQYFNTTDSKMYFCNGTSWIDFSVGAFTLPYVGSANSTGTVGFQINQFGSNSSGAFGIFNSTNNNPALNVFTNGTNFAGSFSSSNATPKALRTIGGVQFIGIGEGAGKVLTSDGVGNATWQNAAPSVAFMGRNSTDGVLNNNQENVVAFGQQFDEGDNFTGIVFTAPQNGIYHFDAGVKFGANTASSNFSQATIKKCDNGGANCVIMASSKINNQVASQHTLSITLKLVAGEEVKVFILQTNSNNVSRIYEGEDANGNRPTYFSGHLVR